MTTANAAVAKAASEPRFGNIRSAVATYQERGFRCIPLYGVSPEGECLCWNPLCKPRDHGKHEPPDTDGAWKEGRAFTQADFRDTDNVALAMGPWRRGFWLLALDVDGADDASAFFPNLPRTLTQKTPRGVHLIYTVPEYTPIGNWVDCFRTKRAGFSLDLRYARGRIVVAPSRGSAGAYVWRDWRAPAPLPQRCVDAILSQRHELGLPVLDRWERDGKQP